MWTTAVLHYPARWLISGIVIKMAITQVTPVNQDISAPKITLVQYGFAAGKQQTAVAKYHLRAYIRVGMLEGWLTFMCRYILKQTAAMKANPIQYSLRRLLFRMQLRRLFTILHYILLTGRTRSPLQLTVCSATGQPPKWQQWLPIPQRVAMILPFMFQHRLYKTQACRRSNSLLHK